MARPIKNDVKKSDIIRQRRSDQTKRNVDRKVKRAQSMPASHSTPIMVRRGVIGAPVMNVKANVKRKYNVPLRNGAEVTIPALPILRPGWRLLSGFISITLSVFLMLILFSSIFDISTVIVYGPKRIKPVDIQNVLDLSESAIFAVSPAEVLATLETAFPELYDVEIKVELPAAVTITAKERIPVLAWHYDNLTVWIDKDGHIFPARGSEEDLFTIYSSEGPPRTKIPLEEGEEYVGDENADDEDDSRVKLKDGPVDPEFIREVLDLHEKMPEVMSLSYNITDGFGWNDQKNNWNVYFGQRLTMLDQKINLYEHIKSSLLAQGLRPNLISVAFIEAPFYRLEQ